MDALVIQSQANVVADQIHAVTDWPDEPAPPGGSVVVRTDCSALNHMDLWVGRGVPGLDLAYPRVSGCDACGVVDAVGDGVDAAWLGRRVIVNAAVRQPDPIRPEDPTANSVAALYYLTGEHTNGMHRRRFTVRADQLVAISDEADPVDAAAFGLVTLTAYSMMVTKAGLRPGQWVLITGIGGGVATSALGIARWMACPTIVTSRHQHKLDRARDLGAAHTILDEGQDWSREVRTITHKRGVDLAVDSVGKPTHMSCIKSLARGGAFVTPGNTGGPRVETDQARLFWNQLRLLGSTMGTTDELRECGALFDAGSLRPPIDSVHAWRDGQAAWARLESQQQFGKVVIDWRED
ncbi:MAG: zinc-binding dehydrogenase [Planctomycetota bacterium]